MRVVPSDHQPGLPGTDDPTTAAVVPKVNLGLSVIGITQDQVRTVLVSRAETGEPVRGSRSQARRSLQSGLVTACHVINDHRTTRGRHDAIGRDHDRCVVL